MNRVTTRLIALLLIIPAILGILVSLVGFYGLVRITPGLSDQMVQLVSTTSRTMQATADLMVVIDGSLTEAEVSMNSIETTFTNTAAALKSTSDMTASIGSMLGEELAGILMETQNSLTSVQASARLIDDTLGIISRIPLIGARYAPDVPLATSIERVNTSLDPLPDTLSDVQTNLVNTSEDIARLEGDLEALSTHIQDLNTQLKDAHAVLSDYQAITLETQAGLAGLEENTPNMVQAFIWAFGAFLLWLLLSQLGLLLLGLHMLRKGELVTN